MVELIALRQEAPRRAAQRTVHGAPLRTSRLPERPLDAGELSQRGGCHPSR